MFFYNANLLLTSKEKNMYVILGQADSQGGGGGGGGGGGSDNT